MRLLRPFRGAPGAYAAIVLAVFAIHTLLLANDGFYWDGWIYAMKVAERDWQTLFTHFRDAGFPSYALVHWSMGYFPDLNLAYRLLSVASLAATAVLTRAVLVELALTDDLENVFVALLAAAYPAFAISVSQFMAPGLALYAIFLLGALLALKAERRRGRAHLALRGASLACFLASFEARITLSLYAGFALTWLLVLHRSRGVSLRDIALRYLPRLLDYIALPFAYVLFSQIVFPPRAVFAAAYTLASGSAPLGVFVALLYFAVYEPLNNALRSVAEQPAAWLVMVLAFLFYRRAPSRPAWPSSGSGPRADTATLAIAGGVLLFFAILPFAALGRTPTAHGWLQRYALLVPLPVALLIVAGVRVSLARRASGLAAGLVLVTVVAGLVISTVQQYLVWQARWARDRSIMLQLAAMPGARGFSVYWIDDGFPVGGQDYYSIEDFYEWASLFKAVWEGESRIGLDLRADALEIFRTQPIFHTKMNNLSEFDPAGCQAVLTIRRGSLSYADGELAARYLYYRLFDRRRLDDLLQRLTEVQVRPKPSPEATHCRG